MELNAHVLWNGLAWPLVRLCFAVSVGLFVGNLIESLNWTRAVAKVAAPLIRLARLQDISGASFSMAFFSGAAANSMLAEAYEQGKMTDREVILSNLFNSLPTNFLHLPTVLALAVPFLREAAFVYVGLTVLSALIRTAVIVGWGRFTLPPLPEGCVVCLLNDGGFKGLGPALRKTWERFKKRLPRLLFITVPVYTLFFFLKRWGVFDMVESAMSHSLLLAWLPPEAVGVVAFQLAAETTAGFAAAGALLTTGALSVKEMVLALLVGAILSTPMRAVRHQFPYYAGIFKTRLAVRLILHNQALRAATLALVAALYALLG
ncbi:hypothetical protein M7784_10160 [Desulfovibrio aminophilus]|nr:hypothetical protein [Desulfovibrio aminophilus]MCM0755607.1 hypothetical protein [Desulfovibrio aminophilus]